MVDNKIEHNKQLADIIDKACGQAHDLMYSIHVQGIASYECGFHCALFVLFSIYKRRKFCLPYIDIEGLDLQEQKTYNDLFCLIQPYLSHKYVIDLIRDYWYNLSAINDDSYEEVYFAVSHFILKRLNNLSSRRDAWIVSKDISQLIADILSQYKIQKVYMPFVKDGMIAIQLPKDIRYYGQESHTSSAICARTNLLLNKFNNFQIDNVDPFEKWSYDSFDAVIGIPPWGVKINVGSSYIASEDYSLKEASSCGTISIGIYPLGILFRDNAQSLRQSLIDHGLVETIIMLPSGVFGYTSIPSCMIITNKDNQHPESVKYIDATQLFTKKAGARQIDLSVDKIFDLYKANDIRENVQFVSRDQIASKSYNLSWEIYKTLNLNIPNGYRLVELRDLLNISTTNNPDYNASAPVVKVGDLSRNQLDVNLNIDKLEVTEFRREWKLLKKDALLISRISKLKPTIFQYRGRDIFISNNIFAFEVNTRIASYNYVANELYQDYVQKQLSYKGAAQLIIGKNDILSVKILIPENLSQQEDRVAQSVIQLAKEQEQFLEAKLEAARKDYFSIVSNRKHNMDPHVGQIRSSIDNIFEYFDQQKDQINMGKKEVDELIQFVKECLEDASKAVDSLADIMKVFARPTKFGKAEKLNIYQILESYKPSFLSAAPYVCVFEPDDSAIAEYLGVDSKGVNVSVNMAVDDFSRLLQNIYENACKHGFDDPTRRDYRIVCHLGIEPISNQVKLEFRNNGTPFPIGYTKENYGTPSDTAGAHAGTGDGGAQVKDIVLHYGGDFDIQSTEEDGEMLTSVFITLPLIEDDEK